MSGSNLEGEVVVNSAGPEEVEVGLQDFYNRNPTGFNQWGETCMFFSFNFSADLPIMAHSPVGQRARNRAQSPQQSRNNKLWCDAGPARGEGVQTWVSLWISMFTLWILSNNHVIGVQHYQSTSRPLSSPVPEIPGRHVRNSPNLFSYTLRRTPRSGKAHVLYTKKWSWPGSKWAGKLLYHDLQMSRNWNSLPNLFIETLWLKSCRTMTPRALHSVRLGARK